MSNLRNIVMVLLCAFSIFSSASCNPLHEAIEQNKPWKEIIQLLGSPKNPSTHYRETKYGGNPLHTACWIGRTYIAYKLVKFFGEAIVCETDYHGNTPLHIAAYRSAKIPDQSHKIMQLLCKYHADLWAVNDKGYMPIHITAFRGAYKCTRYLLLKDPLLLYAGTKGRKAWTPSRCAGTLGRRNTLKPLFQEYAKIIRELSSL